MNLNLAGKKALITGASKGIGLAIAKRFAIEGCSVIFVARSEDDLKKAQRDILATNQNVAVDYRVADLSNTSEVNALAKEQRDIDILVNNAGTNIPEPFEKIQQKSMNYIVDLNLKAAFNVAQLVVKKMLKNKKRGGSIINMSSQLGHVGMPGRNVYNMTKFGI